MRKQKLQERGKWVGRQSQPKRQTCRGVPQIEHSGVQEGRGDCHAPGSWPANPHSQPLVGCKGMKFWSFLPKTSQERAGIRPKLLQQKFQRARSGPQGGRGCWRAVTPTWHLDSGCPTLEIFHINLQMQGAPCVPQVCSHACLACPTPHQPGGALQILCTLAPPSPPLPTSHTQASSSSPTPLNTEHMARPRVGTTCLRWGTNEQQGF